MNTFSGLVTQLPPWITPTVAGLTVGSVVGVVGFLAVLLLVGRSDRRRATEARRMISARSALAAANALHIPPYHTLQRDTPLPPAAFQAVPGSNLAAPSFGPFDGEPGSSGQGSISGAQGSIECEMDDFEQHTRVLSSSSSAVSVAPIVVLEAVSHAVRAHVPPPSSSAVFSAAPPLSEPHPLGIIPHGSSAMAVEAAPPSDPAPAAFGAFAAFAPTVLAAAPAPAPRPASFADLEMDDGATEIAETVFDEPPQQPQQAQQARRARAADSPRIHAAAAPSRS